jgi:SWIM/SEC-C metal-binding protein
MAYEAHMESKIDRIFDGKKPTKLGTAKRPARVRVQTEERKRELEAIFEGHGWSHEITVDADKPEDTADLDRLQSPVVQVKAASKVGRNEPCPCGSGKKYKKCCGR